MKTDTPIPMPAAQPPAKFLLHGTSEYAFSEITSGANRVRPVFTESNPSLGGCYLTEKLAVAEHSAMRASRAHGGREIILIVKTVFPLLPDEDWVVAASERPLPEDFDNGTERWRTARYEGFFSELFSNYLGEGHSLSDEYARRYAELNGRYGITFTDSLRYTGTARQAEPLVAAQVMLLEGYSPWG